MITNPLELARRDFLGRMTTGMTGVALSRLMAGDLAAASSSSREPHHAPRAKQVL